MKAPYIGITDFMTGDQANMMLDTFRVMRLGKEPRRLMVGVMMSYKTMHGLRSSWTDAFAPKGQIQNIFVEHPLAMNTLHYADYDNNTSLSDLIQATDYGGRHMHALQLDMVWPTPMMLLHYKDRHPDIEIVLQVGKNALELVNNDPKEMISALGEYQDCLDYILLDKSMGKGKGMDSGVLLPFVREAYSELSQVGVAVAGGLGPETMHLVLPIAERYPDVSIDAQGRLRPSGDAHDPIDWHLAMKYILRASTLFE